MSDDRSRFAENFQRLLGLHLCTQERAAELLGVSRSSVANWVTGTKEPGLSSLMRIAEEFQIDPVRFAQLPFVELLPDLLDAQRFAFVEKGIGLRESDEGIKVVPLKPTTELAAGLKSELDKTGEQLKNREKTPKP